MSRRILGEDEKRQIRERSPKCFICNRKLGEPRNLVYDHIKSLARGGTNDLSNFAAVHRECHKGKGTKDLEKYKEELRLKSVFTKYPTFASLCGKQKPLDVKIDYKTRTVSIDGEALPLYKEPNINLWYFYHQIPKVLIESDVETQPRPLEAKRLLNLGLHLRHNFQLSPSVCRLVTKDKKILLFDGQHKAAAQILGNKNEIVDCKVFIDPSVEMVFDVIKEGHGRLKQQTFKISDLAKKYRAMFEKEITNWEKTHGTTPTESQILLGLKGMSKRETRDFIQKLISINVRDDDRCMLSDYISEKRKADYPLTYRMYYKDLIRKLACLEPINVPIEHENDFRGEEQTNIIHILNLIVVHALDGKWTPKTPKSEVHRITYNMFRESPFRHWTTMLADAISFIVRRPVRMGVCYGKDFTSDELRSIGIACQRLFGHPVWRDPGAQPVFRSKNIDDIKNLFDKFQLNEGYLAKP